MTVGHGRQNLAPRTDDRKVLMGHCDLATHNSRGHRNVRIALKELQTQYAGSGAEWAPFLGPPARYPSISFTSALALPKSSCPA